MSTIDFVHCNKCLVRPKSGSTIKIFITSCFHLFCDKCIDEDGKPCKICGKLKKAVEMKRDVDPRILNFFQDPQMLISSKLEGLIKKHNFQMSMTKSLSSTFRKQRERLMQLQQHAQKFASVAKEKEKEIAKLKEWCEAAEPKIKELELERDALKKELLELKTTGNRFNSNAFEASYLFDQPQSFSVSQTFDNQPTEDVNMNDSIDSDSNNNLASIEFLSIPLSSPAASNSSLISEVTTPKLLGLVPRREPQETQQSIFAPSRKTPARSYNPYLDVINKGNNSQVHPLTSSFGKRSSSPASRSTLISEGRSPVFTPNMVSCTTKIIPSVNTPSFTRKF